MSVWVFFILFILIPCVYLLVLTGRVLKRIDKRFNNKIVNYEPCLEYIDGVVVDFKKWHERNEVLHIEFWLNNNGLEKKYHITGYDLSIRKSHKIRVCECCGMLVAIKNMSTGVVHYIKNDKLLMTYCYPKSMNFFTILNIVVFIGVCFYFNFGLAIFLFILMGLLLIMYWKVKSKRLMLPIWNRVSF
ncbi:hypothetical protein [Vibrio navarrensis]|uniref:hypothetical protein n=1 Tax=Vibrio navarrensis TaxID=29495 RepID=UPI00051DA6CF|nr:hypothetical protein [Vibrio navarrensis]KGK13439.1 hypothetical protein EA25_03410 [Vibrio navarrensis]